MCSASPRCRRSRSTWARSASSRPATTTRSARRSAGCWRRRRPATTWPAASWAAAEKRPPATETETVMPAARARRTADVEVPVRPRARSDVYVGLLLIALLAQLAGVMFLFLDYNAFPDKAPPKVSDRPPALVPGGPAPAPGPAAPGAGAQGAQP